MLADGPSTQGPSQSPAATDAVDTDGAQITIVKQAGPADGADFTFSSNIPPERGASIITTVAGDGARGFGGDGGLATSARLYAPPDVTVDSAGNLLIADTANERIRKVEVGSFRLDHADPDDGDRVRQSVNFSNLPAGSYAITENVPIGW